MSLNALVYRSRASLTIDVDSLGAVKDVRTGEYYFPGPEHDGKFPREVFIAHEFWIGNVMSVAELRQEMRTITRRADLLLETKCLYSGTHSGDVIGIDLFPALECEIRDLFDRHRPQLSDPVVEFLTGMLELIQAAERENPIAFV